MDFYFFIGIAVISSYIGLYSGSLQKCQLMVSWWKAIYPQLSFLLAMESTNALPFSKHPSLLGHFIHSNSGPSIILAYILGFILIFWVTYSTKVYTALKNISHNFKFYSFGFFLVWIGCILIYARAMHDLGRQIPMENFYAIIMIVTIHKLNIIDGNLLPKYKKINLSNSFVLLLIGAYLFAWQIKVFINYNVPTYLDTQLWQRMILFINSSFS